MRLQPGRCGSKQIVMPNLGTIIKGIALIFLAGVAWATVVAQLDAHISETTELLDVSKETCYAMHKHANLDPVGCYEKTRRGRKH
jgi:hypothetical protein